MEYHDPLNASLVLPFQRPRDGRSTLPILPSLPQLGLLRCREPNPRRHHGTPPSPRKIRRCCADRLNPPPQSGHSAMFLFVRFSNRPSGSSTFRLTTTPVSMSLTGSRFSSDSAPRPFHHGDSKTRWNNLSGGLAVNMTAGPSGQTISPHPSSREGHHSTARWSSISSYRI